ncbi:MAG: hypothetical protein AAF620_08160 [Bacteroidota bacterium]
MSKYSFNEIELGSQNDYNTSQIFYCQSFEDNTDNEIKAVQSAFNGDYKEALKYATRDASSNTNPVVANFTDQDSIQIDQMIRAAESMLSDPNSSEEKIAESKKILSLLRGPVTAEEAFKEYQRTPALEYIVTQGESFHFTLINEAHYCSQHRNFTHQLLEPLWDSGYRYLALETLSHYDTALVARRYPTYDSGPYLADSNFGNLVQSAIDIGYILVPYETLDSQSGTLRDFDQAQNILNATWLRDTVGKVLVHAGYSHINEVGFENYRPMGSQLKKMSEQDILTIDQVFMTPLNDNDKNHAFYNYVNKDVTIEEPIVCLNPGGVPVIDPVSRESIDIQVYHPKTSFVHGRPDWIKNENNHYISLSKAITAYKGNLLVALDASKLMSAVPADKLVIEDDIKLILPTGSYVIMVINCDNKIIKRYSLEV